MQRERLPGRIQPVLGPKKVLAGLRLILRVALLSFAPAIGVGLNSSAAFAAENEFATDDLAGSAADSVTDSVQRFQHNSFRFEERPGRRRGGRLSLDLARVRGAAVQFEYHRGNSPWGAGAAIGSGTFGRASAITQRDSASSSGAGLPPSGISPRGPMELDLNVTRQVDSALYAKAEAAMLRDDFSGLGGDRHVGLGCGLGWQIKGPIEVNATIGLHYFPHDESKQMRAGLTIK